MAKLNQKTLEQSYSKSLTTGDTEEHRGSCAILCFPVVIYILNKSVPQTNFAQKPYIFHVNAEHRKLGNEDCIQYLDY